MSLAGTTAGRQARLAAREWGAAFGLFLACIGSLPAVAQTAGPVSGVVTDRTTGKPSPDDRVALIAFNGGMQIATETRTDARGHYTLQIPDSAPHLIRVTHQKATYFQQVSPGARTADVDVYDVAPAVEGVTTEADVLSMQPAPGPGGSAGGLRVTEDFFVRNDSKPARTQLSDHAYEFFLPEDVTLLGTAAEGPGGMAVQSSPVPLPGKGHYAFVFPIRPGETRFQVSYSVPYSGTELHWTQREALPTENLVVLLPKSMRFAPGSTEWQPVPANPDAQTFVHKGATQATAVEFGIAGQGELPRESQATSPNGEGGNTPGAGTAAGGNTATSGSMATDTRPGGGLGPPVDTPDPLNRYKGWLLGGLGVLLLAGAAWLLRPVGGTAQPGTASEPGETDARALRPALERALLALEREHALGTIDEEEYREVRTALQRALHRALAREAAGAAAPLGAEPVKR